MRSARRDVPGHRRLRRLAAAVAGALVLTACGEAAPSDPAAGETQPSVATTTPDAATPPPDAATSPATEPTAATVPSGLDGATLFGIAGARGRLVTVGAHDGGAAAWTSDDGVTWQPADVADADQPGPLRAVAAGQDGLVAFGGRDDEASRAWTSTDGTEWARDTDATGIEARINAVTAGDDRWTAVGDVIAGAEGGESLGGAVYTSRNGRAWDVVTDELTANELTVSDVAAGDGVLVVVGFDVDGGRVWTGSERMRPATGDFAAATIQGVAATDSGFVALGRGIADLRPDAWTSPDGRSWDRADLDGAAFRPDDQINDLAWIDGRLVAVGASPSGGLVWTSDDGVTWTRQP